MSAKSPISILQEYYIKRGILPQYTTVKEIDEKAGPFTIKVEVDGLSAIGSGLSKKEAKHNAAQALLKQLKKLPKENHETSNGLKEKEEVSKPQVSGIDRPVRPNFVGKLQEHMLKRKSFIPRYTLVSEEGPPHMKQFTMKCTVKDMEEIGTAQSKREAKNVAAEKIWARLQSDEASDDSFTGSKRRKLVDDESFDEALKQFRALVDDIGGSFSFEEETPKEYAIDAGGNADELSKYDASDRKMFAFLGSRSFTSLLPEKTSIVLTIDSGVESRTIGARAWTRRDAMHKALNDAIDYLSKRSSKNEAKDSAGNSLNTDV